MSIQMFPHAIQVSIMDIVGRSVFSVMID